MEQMKELGDYTKIRIADPRFLSKIPGLTIIFLPAGDTNISLLIPGAMSVDRAHGNSLNESKRFSNREQRISMWSQFSTSSYIPVYTVENLIIMFGEKLLMIYLY